MTNSSHSLLISGHISTQPTMIKDILVVSVITKANLKKHQDSIHKGIKKYQCDECDHQATQKGDLKRHKQSKYEEKSN